MLKAASPHQRISKRSSTLHDFPYVGFRRKCYHPWIINVTPPGQAHCIHNCTFCYAREAIYSDLGEQPIVYDNLPELIEQDLARISLVPPVLLCTTTDPCQAVDAVREETRRIVATLVRHGVPFAITTKGNPAFLGELKGFWEYERKAVLVSIEGPPEVLSVLSPHAPSYEARLATVRAIAQHQTWVGVRLDPYFVHVYQGLYGANWWKRTEALLDAFAEAGARHVTGSTGRLDHRRSRIHTHSMFSRLLSLVASNISVEAAEKMSHEYVPGWSGTCRGYVLRENLRRELHQRLREACERRHMTYASCQELPRRYDSAGLATCEGFCLPYMRRERDSSLRPIEGCTANCHVTCAGLDTPPCGRPELVRPAPYQPSMLR
ncbi:MAG: hypothetical protein ACUVX8_15125 [Candidatus Zipacnadales bacterium]